MQSPKGSETALIPMWHCCSSEQWTHVRFEITQICTAFCNLC